VERLVEKIGKAGRQIGSTRMTGDQSRKLKVGDRVSWAGSLTDQGTVSAVDWTGVTIKWGNGHTNSVRHNDMAQVERVPLKR
jgi:hypothetical protein